MQLTEPLPRHRLTVSDYHRMGEAGILSEKDRVELIEGDLIEMAPIGSQHASVVDDLVEVLVIAAGEDAKVRAQGPIQLSDYSEPEPDISLLKRTNYRNRQPGPSDILLLIEISDTSLQYDRNTKIPLYAEHGIPEVWLIDINKKCAEIYLQPDSDGYQKILRPKQDEQIFPSLLPGVSVNLGEIWKS